MSAFVDLTKSKTETGKIPKQTKVAELTVDIVSMDWSDSTLLCTITIKITTHAHILDTKFLPNMHNIEE